MGFILFLTALSLSLVLVPIGFIFTFVKAIYKRSIGSALKRLNDYFFVIAYSIDQYGNVVCQDLFNLILIKKSSSNLFGNPDETISSVIGKNKLNKTLTLAGKGLEFMLHLLDKNHSVKSIEQNK